MSEALNKLDPRIRAIFQNRPPHEQFLAAGMVAILGPSKAEKLVDAFAPRDIDWQQRVAGHPMHFWNNKTRDQVKMTIGDDKEKMQEIADALEARGLKFPEDARAEADKAANVPATPEAGEPGTPAEPAGEFPPAGTPAAANTPDEEADTEPGDTATASAPNGEPKFAGHPYSELKGKSDTELLALPNIGRGTIQKIREFEAMQGNAAAGA